MLFDKVIAFDNVKQKIVLIVNIPLSDVEVGYNKAIIELKATAELLSRGEKKTSLPAGFSVRSLPCLTKSITAVWQKRQSII